MKVLFYIRKIMRIIFMLQSIPITFCRTAKAFLSRESVCRTNRFLPISESNKNRFGLRSLSTEINDSDERSVSRTRAQTSRKETLTDKPMTSIFWAMISLLFRSFLCFGKYFIQNCSSELENFCQNGIISIVQQRSIVEGFHI